MEVRIAPIVSVSRTSGAAAFAALCAALMDVLLNAVLCAYMYLIGEEITLLHLGRILISMLYTVALALILTVPLRYVLGMYRKRKPREGGELP